MSPELEKVLASITGVVKSLHERVEEQEKIIAELKGKAAEEHGKDDISDEEKKTFARKIAG